jgi:hypothetical protein
MFIGINLPFDWTNKDKLMIIVTEQPLSDALAKLKKIIRDNVYV